MNDIERRTNQIISLVKRKGYPEAFGLLIAQELGTEKQMARMIGYLLSSKKVSMEDIADEMLAIKSDFQNYKQKKITEYNNSKYNEILNKGLDEEEI